MKYIVAYKEYFIETEMLFVHKKPDNFCCPFIFDNYVQCQIRSELFNAKKAKLLFNFFNHGYGHN